MKIKDESYNPYGTHKDRRSEYIINVAIENNVDKIVCLTAWNAGYSLSRYCARAGIDYTSLVFPWVSDDRLAILREWWQVITIDGARYNWILRPRDFQQIVAEYDKYERDKERKKIWAVTNSFEPISINAYKELFYEIKDENPDYVVVPCGSGDILIGLWLGIKELWMNTKIIWVGPKNEHPLKYALKYATDEYQIDNYRENSHAEKLTTPFTAVLPILYKIFSEKGNIYTEVCNDEILKTRNIVEWMWFKVENSAVPAFATFLSENKPDIDPESKVIIVSTGKGVEN
jgi:threonine synthase